MGILEEEGYLLGGEVDMKGWKTAYRVWNVREIISKVSKETVISFWVERHTSLPGWLKKRSGGQQFVYWFALACTILALLLAGTLSHFFPPAQYALVSMFLVILVFLGLEFGAGPALAATLLGGIGILVFPLPTLSPHFSAPANGTLAILTLSAGLVIDGLLFRRECLLSPRQQEKEALTPDSIPLETIFESIADGVMVSDLEGAIIRFNAAVSILGVEQHPEYFARPFQERIKALDMRDENDQLFPPGLFPRTRIIHGETIASKDAIDMIIHRLDGQASEILLDLPDHLDIIVCMDAMRIEQVLSNYLANAFKYALGESPVRVIVRVEDARQCVRVLVEDQGPGIALEDQPRIWGRFYQIDGRLPEGDHNEGLGLGLFISKTIIEQHQGDVGVEIRRQSNRRIRDLNQTSGPVLPWVVVARREVAGASVRSQSHGSGHRPRESEFRGDSGRRHRAWCPAPSIEQADGPRF